MTERILNHVYETEPGENYGVVARNLNLRAGVRELLKNANFSIYPGRKIALIGRNGSGKTTLLTTIGSLTTKNKVPDHVEIEGELFILPTTRVGYLPQDVQISFSGTVREYLDSQSTVVAETFNRFGELTAIFNSKDGSEEELAEYGLLLDKMSEIGAWNYPKQRLQVLGGLGLSEEYLNRNMRQISGGESTKVALAGILLGSPNLLLLDEPTNNLDPQTLRFLGEWIRSAITSLLIVSHDREFLDQTIDEVLEIDEDTHQVTLFGGNYSFYKVRKGEIFEAQLRRYEDQERKRHQLETKAQMLRSEAKRFENISNDSFYRTKGANIAKRASVQLARIKRDLEKIPKPQPPKKPKITVINSETDKAVRLLEADQLSFSYQNGQNIIESLNTSIYNGDRVAIIGSNGIGKTTLLKLFMGELRPSSGRANLKGGTKIAYLPQIPVLPKNSMNLLDFFIDKTNLKKDQASQILGRVLLTDAALIKLGDLSVGEIRRMELVGVFTTAPDMVALDEPTNHLDIYTIEQVEKAIEEFNGAVVTVSHDLRFLVNIDINKLLVLTPDGIAKHKIETPHHLEDIFQQAFT